MLALRTI